MDILIWFICAISLSWFMAYHKATLSTYTLAFIGLMAISTFLDITSLFSWIIFACIALPLNILSFRLQYITKPLLQIFKSIMPEMSKTEQEAIDAGTTWFDADLFRGTPDWAKLHKYPQPRLSKEEREFLDGPVEKVCQMVDDWHTTHEIADISPDVWQYLKDNKFFAMIIKKEYGGLEFCAYAQSRVLQKLSAVSTVLASTVGVPNSLGPAELLQHYGTKEQQEHYLPRLATGEEIPDEILDYTLNEMIFFNWQYGYLKNALQEVNRLLKNEETRWLIQDYQNGSALKNLRNQPIFLSENVLIKTNALTGEQNEQHDIE